MDDFSNSSKQGKVAYVVMILFNFALVSFVVSQLLTWFVTPVSLVQAMGINIIWTFYAMRGPRFKKELLNQPDLFNRLIESYVMCVIAFIMGFALSFFL